MQVYELTDQSVNGANVAFGAYGLLSRVEWFGACMNQRTSSGANGAHQLQYSFDLKAVAV